MWLSIISLGFVIEDMSVTPKSSKPYKCAPADHLTFDDIRLGVWLVQWQFQYLLHLDLIYFQRFELLGRFDGHFDITERGTPIIFRTSSSICPFIRMLA